MSYDNWLPKCLLALPHKLLEAPFWRLSWFLFEANLKKKGDCWSCYFANLEAFVYNIPWNATQEEVDCAEGRKIHRQELVAPTPVLGQIEVIVRDALQKWPLCALNGCHKGEWGNEVDSYGWGKLLLSRKDSVINKFESQRKFMTPLVL